MLMGPVLTGERRRARKGKKEDTKTEKDGGTEGEGGMAKRHGGKQGMDVFTLYPLFF